MNRTSVRYTLAAVIAFTFVLVSFQNCAEQPLPELTTSSVDDKKDDEPTTATIDNLNITVPNVTEGDTLAIQITLDRAYDTPQTFEYETRERAGANAAEEGTDYTAKSGTINFAAGQTEKTINVVTIENTVDATSKSFDFVVGIFDTASSRFGIRTFTISIMDDDTTVLTFPDRVYHQPQTATVLNIPAGASKVLIRAWGAGGGGGGAAQNDGNAKGNGGDGGGGGYAQGLFPVQPGDTLKVYVGGGGKRGATVNDGGGTGGGGGGFTKVELVRDGNTYRLVIAGGGGAGGGGGNNGFGGIYEGRSGGAGGSNIGKNGVSVPSRAAGGLGGSSTAGGDGGACVQVGFQGLDGASLQGGRGGSRATPAGVTVGGLNGGGMGGDDYSAGGGGGGGGAGLFGGGGGGCGDDDDDDGGAGGGGGSNFLNSTGTSTASLAGSGRDAAHSAASDYYPITGDSAFPGKGGKGTTNTDAGSEGHNGRVVISPKD